MINIIISVKGLQKISDRIYIRHARLTKFIITSDRYNRYQISNRYQTSNRYQISVEMSVNYQSLLNFVYSVIIINAKYVD